MPPDTDFPIMSQAMNVRILRHALPLLAALAISACEYNPQALVDSGAARLDAAAAQAHIAGNTEFWEAGPVYYYPDGRLETIWRKVKSDGSWTVGADGEVCLSTRTWDKCHYYLAQEGEVFTVVDGKVRGINKTQAGNRLRR